MEVLKFELWSKKTQQIIKWELVKEKPYTIFQNWNYIPMQYTGINDIDNREIYNGYLLNITMIDKNTKRVVIEKDCEVVFSEGCFGVLWGDNNIFTPLRSFSKSVAKIKVKGVIYG